MYFKYTALNPEHKKLIGTIEAQSEAEAREKLNTFGFSIIDIHIFKPEEAKKETQAIKRFSFEGKDAKSRKIIGSIEANSDEEAFEKLTEDYKLEISQMFSAGASNEEKTKAVSRLTEIKENLAKKRGKKAQEEKMQEEAIKQERTNLLKTIEQTIQVIQKFLNEYGNDMKTEERDTVRNYVNQLLRIKDSTNLAHIRRTCELMLDYIQKQEIFLAEARRIKEQTVLRAETHEFLEELKKTGLQKELKLKPFLEYISGMPVLSPVGRWLLALTQPAAPEIAKFNEQIKNINHRIIEFIKMYLKQKDAAYRSEIKANIAELWNQRKRLKKELAAVRQKIREERRKQKTAEGLRTWESLPLLIGSLLAFYLLFYFITFPIASRNADFSNLPKSFYFYDSPLLQSILIFLFLTYASLSLRRNFMPAKTLVDMVLFPSTLLIYLLFIFNFVY